MVTVNRVSTAAAATSSTPTLKQGSKGASVKTLQQKLKNAGYNVAVDGEFGPKTAAAVKKYQAAHGLVADGVVGPKTWAKLNASAPAPKPPASTGATPTLKQGASGAAVKNLQTRLRAHGYNVSVDGAFGPATASAVKQFQSSKGLSADGIVGPKTWAALDKVISVSGRWGC